jgi:selenocysteine-specific elongation factor
VGDELDLHTSHGARRVQVRGLHSLSRTRTSVHGVARVAVNLRAVSHDEVARGDALVTPGTVTRTHLVDVRVRRGPGTTAMPPQCRVHLGSAQVTGTVRPLGDDVVRLRLSHALPLRLGDRLLLRDSGRRRLVGVAVVLDLRPPALRRRGEARRRGAALSALADEPQPASELARRGTVTVAELRAMGFSRPDVDALAALRVAGGHLVDPAAVPRLRTRLVAAVRQHRRDRPLDPGLPLEGARQQLGLPDARLVAAVVRDGAAEESAEGLIVSDGRVELAGDDDHGLPGEVAAAVRLLRADLARRPFAAPEVARLRELGLDRRALGAAVRHGQLARVADDVYLAPDWLERATAVLDSLPEPFGVADVKRALDTTRRVAVPVLERLDADRVTRRLPDDRRVLRRDGRR